MASQSPALPVSLETGRRARFAAGAGLIALYCLGHFFIDLYSSALSVYQPLLIGRLGFSLTQAGLLGGLLVFSSSVLQPLYGYMADRWPSRLYSVLAPGLSGVFIGLLGYSSGFGVAAACVLLAGTGIAAFHPHASSRVTRGMEANKGRWMSVFISAGTLGLALGPLILSALLSTAGLEGSLWAALPGLAVTGLLLKALPSENRSSTHARPAFDWLALRAVWRPLSLLYAAVFLRSVVQITFTQFLALYLHQERGYSLAQSASVLSLYLASGAIGGFAGGHLSDRIGGRRTIMLSFLGSVPFLALFFWLTGWASVACLALGGLILLFTIPVNVVIAQELVPSQAGTVSALMMGFAWGTAGMIFIPFTGWLSDQTSLHAALRLLVLFPLAGYFLTRHLPKDL
jgi:FSR family fosmidomycin resistance protein-like MFS transporter